MMRKVHIALTSYLVIILTAFAISWKVNSHANPTQIDPIKVGDVIFQTTSSTQSKAIKLATESDYSHCGIVVKVDGELMVLEAIQPVQLTSLQSFLDRGINGYVVKRLKPIYGPFPDKEKSELDGLMHTMIGKNYDVYFSWDDRQLYCSELVWKLYDQYLGIELCKPRPLNSYQLNHPIVKSNSLSDMAASFRWMSSWSLHKICLTLLNFKL